MHPVGVRGNKHFISAYRLLTTTQKTDVTSSSALPVSEVVTEANQFEQLSNAVTPLWKVHYKVQLEQKLSWTKNIFYNIVRIIRRQKKGIFMKPEIDFVTPSPVMEEYRNKDEYNIRTGVDGNPKTVGFFVGSTAKKTAVCVPPTHIINMKSSHKAVAQAFQDFIRKSKLDACYDLGPGGGHWQRVIVRSNEIGQLMAIAVCHPQSLSMNELQDEKQQLAEYFVSGPGASCNLFSLYFQACRNTRCTNEIAPFELLHGEPYLSEKLSGYTFRISPDSFFQVNTSAAEVLYSVVLKLANLSSYSTVLDVCCGTGTISILASQHVRGCVGVDAIPDAIHDAVFNAKFNDVRNVSFFSGLVEKKLASIIKELDLASDIVPIINPGRAGLSSRTIRVLNRCPQINKCVYVSCQADNPNTTKNFIQLCEEGRFELRRVIPVDLFPHTLSTELVILFER